jgi:hypothetical protein
VMIHTKMFWRDSSRMVGNPEAIHMTV